jgi:hypothetical protein
LEIVEFGGTAPCMLLFTSFSFLMADIEKRGEWDPSMDAYICYTD